MKKRPLQKVEGVTKPLAASGCGAAAAALWRASLRYGGARE